jgi:hypothetical protein
MSHESQETPSTESENPQYTPKSKGGTARAARNKAYFWGAASGVALALFAPVFRPAARSAVKGGLRVGRYAKKMAASAKEEFEDIAMEAQAELDREDGTKGDNSSKA